MSVKRKSALVLNGYTRNSLAITRSLGAKGIDIDLFTKKEYSLTEDKFNRRFASRYVREVYTYDLESKLETLIGLLRGRSYDYVFAGGTADSLFLAKHAEELEQFAKLASENYDKVLRVHDKLNAAKELSALGIACPPSFRVDSIDSLKRTQPNFSPPYILKFPDSYASKGLEVYDGPKENLYRFFKDHYSDDVLPMIQKKIEGDLVDSTCFAAAGNPIGVLCQKRVLTAWIKGGGGIINRTINAPELVQNSAVILKHFEWNGHLEIDWIYEVETNQYYFLEMNPKYWGTTQLTIDAGYDFPYWSTRLLDGQDLPIAGDYVKNLTYRWVEDELATLLWNNYGFGTGLKLWLSFFSRFLNFRIHSNVYLWSDPRPIIGGMLKLVLRLKNIWVKRAIKRVKN